MFDGGATGTGRPCLVMELVKGIPITDYSDANKLGLCQTIGQTAPNHLEQTGGIGFWKDRLNTYAALNDSLALAA